MMAPAPANMAWRKSTRSSGDGQCVEVANLDAIIAIRDSKAPDAGHLTVAPKTWSAFVAEAKAGRYDQGQG